MIQSLPGTYTLVLHSSGHKPVNIGRLGTLVLQPGFYVYVGSAFGPGGLKARITHHCKRARRPHWHIDYLRPALKLCEIWFTYDRTRREHQWAQIHAQTRGAQLPLPGFGSADCRCPTHLFFYPSQPSGGYFRRKIRVKLDNPARFIIEKSEKFLDNSTISDIH
jgi:Uri superfamily endonuclease